LPPAVLCGEIVLKTVAWILGLSLPDSPDRERGVMMASELSQWIVDLKKEAIEAEVKQRAESGENPIQILNECREGMARVGERFQKGDYYLAELMLS